MGEKAFSADKVANRVFRFGSVVSSASNPGQLNRAGVQLPTALRMRVRLRDYWYLNGTTARCQHWARVNSGFKLPLRLAKSEEEAPPSRGHGGRSADCRLACRRRPANSGSINLRLPSLLEIFACTNDVLFSQVESRTGRKRASFPALSRKLKFRRRRAGAIRLSGPMEVEPTPR